MTDVSCTRYGTSDYVKTGTEREGMTIVPLKISFNDKGRAKVEIALARKEAARQARNHDKRETEKPRDWSREKGRLLREKG